MMKESVSKYLPSNPHDLLHAMEDVCTLPQGTKIIGVIVVIEDDETIQTAALADGDGRAYVMQAVRRAMNAMESDDASVRVFDTNGEENNVRH